MEQDDQNGRLYPVEYALKEVINSYYHAYHTEGEPVVRHFSPNLEITMIFNFGTAVRGSFGSTAPKDEIKQGIFVIGPLRKMLNFELRPGADAISINFKLNGFYRLFKIPLNELDGESIYNAERLTDQYNFAALWKELSGMSNIEARLLMISNYVKTFMDENDDAVQPLLSGEHYFYNPVIQPVKAIAADAQLTERTIQLRFQKYTGYSPKELLRFLRFKTVIDKLMTEQDREVNLFEIVLDFGYHDQSHLIKDFQHFLGTTPQYFIKRLNDKEFCVAGRGLKSQGQ
ncbi:helix-turn-helix domain-containing protein [Pedobacter sp. L105]|uniref:helix-turn-helix domain-containing protein n=1 Tax=Pedobacter sp. L105 TaxID=1641871 RepID=UPI00131C20BF|nr:helix-turn-helix domain-containing protein [Pedobacter sp. L105]